MTSEPPHDPRANQADLGDLAERITRADARTPESQAVLHDLIQGYRDTIAARHRRLMGCMDAASTLVHSLASLDEETAKDVQDVAARLLEVVNEASARELALPSQAEPTVPEPSHERKVSEEGLQTLNDMALCELLIQLGTISQAQVDRALVDSAQSGRAVEDSLYAIGAVGPEDVFRAMKLQKALSAGADHPDTQHKQTPRTLRAILLGEILVSAGRISREQLDQALEHQRTAGIRLGEALVELGHATWEDVAEAVRLQEQRGGSSERNADATVIRLD